MTGIPGLPYEVLPEHVQDSAAWHEARRDSIGASEVAAVMGLSPWQSPLDVWRSKMGVPHDIDEDLAYFGHALEPVVAGWITHKHRERVGFIGSGFTARSLQYPWLTASPDRIASSADGPIPVELKTAGAFTKKHWEEDGIPVQYQVQVQVQCLVLDAPYGWLAVLHGGNTPMLQRVERDDDFLALAVEATGRFWREHVLAQVPPEPISTEEAVSLWPGDADETHVTDNPDVLAAWEEMGRQQALLVEAERAVEGIRLQLEIAMKDASSLVYRDAASGQEQVLFTWKPVRGRSSIDPAALRRDHPDIAAQYTRTGAGSRRFHRKPAPKPPGTPR